MQAGRATSRKTIRDCIRAERQCQLRPDRGPMAGRRQEVFGVRIREEFGLWAPARTAVLAHR
jgi:hypothetical protein